MSQFEKQGEVNVSEVVPQQKVLKQTHVKKPHRCSFP